MQNEEIIKRIYGSDYPIAERYIDEWGRIKASRFDEFCLNLKDRSEVVFTHLRMRKVEENGIVYFQPSALDGIEPEKVPELTTDDLEFLDRVAERVMTEYFNTHPNGFKDNLTIARLAYSQALAMLEMKKNGLQELINKNGLNFRA